MAGRPKEFDRDEALASAMDVFWRRGYEAASVSELLSAMGISRQSLYDTFGDKRRVFLAAIEHYATNNVGRVCGALEAEGSPLGNVRGLLRAVARDAMEGGPDGRRRGCFVVNTAVEFGADDPDVARVVRRCVDDIHTAFRRTFERAKAAGELPSTADATRLTHAVTHAMNGFAVFSRLGMDEAAAENVLASVETTLAAA